MRSNMLGFNSFLLVEASGKDTALSGHSNEHFTNEFIRDYIEHSKKHLASGLSPEEAHNKAMDFLNARSYNKKDWQNHPGLAPSIEHFKHPEMQSMHEDSKKTARGIINHVRNMGYGIDETKHMGIGGPAAVEAYAGKPSEADLAFRIHHNDTGEPDYAHAFLEHLGASLKYSKGKEGAMKIYAPGVNTMADIVDNHHSKLFRSNRSLNDELREIADEGLNNQRKALKKHHSVLQDYFQKYDEENQSKNPSYTPIRENGRVVGGNLSQKAMSHIRDSSDPKLRAAYDSVSAENLKMKNKLAGSIHGRIAQVLDHEPNNPAHNDLKESLIRSISNLHKDKLPTFLVSTSRKNSDADIYNMQDYLQNRLNKDGVSGNHKHGGASTFSVGPLSLGMDTRPTTRQDPLSGPVNVTVSKSQVKKAMSSPVAAPAASSAPAKPKAKPVAARNKLPYNRPGAGRVPQSDSPMASTPAPGLNPDADHGGRSFYAPHEKALMKGL